MKRLIGSVADSPEASNRRNHSSCKFVTQLIVYLASNRSRTYGLLMGGTTVLLPIPFGVFSGVLKGRKIVQAYENSLTKHMEQR